MTAISIRSGMAVEAASAVVRTAQANTTEVQAPVVVAVVNAAGTSTGSRGLSERFHPVGLLQGCDAEALRTPTGLVAPAVRRASLAVTSL